MNPPRNHHYVSRVLINKFVDNNNKVYYFDKSLNNFGESNSTKRIFSERNLNTTLTESGEVDYNSVEENLNKHFETDFNNNHAKFLSALENKCSEELIQSMQYLIRLGIIGEMRTPQNKGHIQETWFETLSILSGLPVEGFRNVMLKNPEITNISSLDYKEICDKVIELMGKTIYSVFMAPEGEYILLPDCTSAALRHQLEDDAVINGVVCLNEARPISTIIFPVNSRLILIAQSAKICPQKYHGTQEISKELVYGYNKIFFERANQKVVCQNKNYLKTFVARYQNEN